MLWGQDSISHRDHKLTMKEAKVNSNFFSKSLRFYCPNSWFESKLIFFDKKPITAMFTRAVFGNGMSRWKVKLQHETSPMGDLASITFSARSGGNCWKNESKSSLLVCSHQRQFFFLWAEAVVYIQCASPPLTIIFGPTFLPSPLFILRPSVRRSEREFRIRSITS